MQICMMQVIPALLPFFVCSILIGAAFTGTDIPLLRPIGRLCRMPKGSESLLVLGLLGGYPAGAQAISQAYKSGQLSKEDAHRLLGFCSNAGPAFLFGIASATFPYSWLPWALWLIHIISALATGMLLPGGNRNAVRLACSRSMNITEALEQAIRIMAKVCGWIILFRIIQSFLDSLFLQRISATERVGVIGLLELANGCLELPVINDLGLRALLCSAFLSLGGLCVTMQTLSVTGSLGLGMYPIGKALQCTISLALTLVMQMLFLPTSELTDYAPLLLAACILFVVLFALVFRKYEKNSSISALVSV